MLVETKERLLTKADVGLALGKASEATVDRFLAQKLLPTVRLGRRVLVPESAVQQFIQKAIRKSSDDTA